MSDNTLMYYYLKGMQAANINVNTDSVYFYFSFLCLPLATFTKSTFVCCIVTSALGNCFDKFTRSKILCSFKIFI